MLTSYIPGRLRVRLSEPPKDVSIENLDFKSWPGVKNLTANPLTGSFLLEYDPDKLSLHAIVEILKEFDEAAAEDLRRIAEGGSRYPVPEIHHHPNQATKDFISLSFSLISSLVTGFWGPKKWHAQAGLFLAGLSVAHAWRYRRRIKPLRKWTVNDILGLPEPKPIPYQAPPELTPLEAQNLDAAIAEAPLDDAPLSSEKKSAEKNSSIADSPAEESSAA
jgi:hypothetical protein